MTELDPNRPITVEEVAEMFGTDFPEAAAVVLTREDLTTAEQREKLAQLRFAQVLHDGSDEVAVAREQAFRAMDRATQASGLAGLETLATSFPTFKGITDTLEMARRVYAEGA